MTNQSIIQNRAVRGFLLALALFAASITIASVRAVAGGFGFDFLFFAALMCFAAAVGVIVSVVHTAERAIAAR